MTATRLGIVCGLQAEAELIRVVCRLKQVPEPPIGISGADPAQARAQAEALAGSGCTALMSFGIAGGLDPALTPGSVVAALAVVLPDLRQVATDGAWVARLRAADDRIGAGIVAGVGQVVDSPAAKAALRQATGAGLVDMESHAVAAVAAARGLPLRVLRAVADPAGRAVPWSAQAGIGPNGESRALPVLGRLLRRPGDLKGLIAIAGDTSFAMSALRRVLLAVKDPFG